jgi:hypothetical protein
MLLILRNDSKCPLSLDAGPLQGSTVVFAQSLKDGVKR